MTVTKTTSAAPEFTETRSRGHVARKEHGVGLYQTRADAHYEAPGALGEAFATRPRHHGNNSLRGRANVTQSYVLICLPRHHGNNSPGARPSQSRISTGLPDDMARSIDRMFTARPPEALLSHVWRQTFLDLSRMCTDGWITEALSQGWTDLDLFACHPRIPLVRVDCMGLLLALESRAITSIIRDSATIHVRSGVHHEKTRPQWRYLEVVRIWELE